MSLAHSASPARFWSHPPGLAILAVTEVWERFSYYGMRALLVFYMTKHLLFAQAVSSQIYGVYTAAVWMAPFFGGLLADRVLGQHRAVLIGGVMMAIGHFLMAFESAFFVALAAIATGSGFFKPNISTQVGDLYAADDPRRTRGYSIFYVGINFGAFLAPLGCGTVGELYGWHWGFGLAGIGMLAGLATYVGGRRWLPADRLKSRRAPAAPAADGGERPLARVLALAAVALSSALFWLVFEQQGNVIALWADGYTDRVVHLFDWTATLPASWFPALNGMFIVLLTPPIVALWRSQSRRGREPPTLTKMALGAALAGIAYLVLVVAAVRAADVGAVSWLWLVGYFAIITTGEIYLSPTCLALFNRVAPARYASTMLGLWYLSLFLGSYFAGYAGTWWQEVAKSSYFAVMAGLAFLSVLALMTVGRTLGPELDTVHDRRGGVPPAA